MKQTFNAMIEFRMAELKIIKHKGKTLDGAKVNIEHVERLGGDKLSKNILVYEIYRSICDGAFQETLIKMNSKNLIKQAFDELNKSEDGQKYIMNSLKEICSEPKEHHDLDRGMIR